MVKRIKDYWNKPITYHVKKRVSGGPIVCGVEPEHDFKTTRGKEICEVAYYIFILLFVIFFGCGFISLFLPA